MLVFCCSLLPAEQSTECYECSLCCVLQMNTISQLNSEQCLTYFNMRSIEKYSSVNSLVVSWSWRRDRHDRRRGRCIHHHSIKLWWRLMARKAAAVLLCWMQAAARRSSALKQDICSAIALRTHPLVSPGCHDQTFRLMWRARSEKREDKRKKRGLMYPKKVEWSGANLLRPTLWTYVE